MPATRSSPPGCRGRKAAALPTCWLATPSVVRASISAAGCLSSGPMSRIHPTRDTPTVAEPGRWDSDSVMRCRRHADIPILDAARLAALQVNRPGQRFMAVESAARDARNLLIVDQRHTIEHDGHAAADERDVVGPPGSGLARGGWQGREISVNAGQAPFGRVRYLFVLHLHFIAPPQVHATVRSRRAVEFDVQLEVFERSIAHQIGAAPGTQERSARDPPRIVGAGIREAPAAEILAI